ncbi:hypothetical protein HGA64_00325 [Candidatus Falkowbacteria bacterium]|nr:hypothetical protein [Candidatus Falkowbacteria bacterium]
MSEKIYLRILRLGVYASFLTTFFVFNNLLFPYITSKQIPFNLLVEVLTFVWIAFLIKYPSWRPFVGSRSIKKDWLSLGLFAFFTILVISCIFGVDFNLSFWGDIERMLGVFHLLHFLALYLIMITVFRSWPEWRNLLGVAVLVSVYQAFTSFPQAAAGKSAFGTLGNTSYISGQMLFGMFFALILFFKQKNFWLRSGYILSIIFMFVAFKNSGTRGAFIGLAVSILLLLFLLAMFNKNLKVRYGSIVVAGLIILGVSLIYTNSNSAWVQNNDFFRRITQINSQANTFQTRILSWKAGMKDLPNHYLLGTGYGNFASSFDKYFDPAFYDWARTETYFDHAHNNLVDLLSTTGILGLLSYLSIFAALVYYMIQAFRKKQISLIQFGLLLALLTAYFIQNVVLFDSFVTYLMLMVLFAYVYSLMYPSSAMEPVVHKVKDGWVNAINGEVTNKGFFLMIGTGLVLLVIAYQFNVKVWKMLDLTIAGQSAAAQSDLPKAINYYKQAFAYNTPLDRDSRNTLVQLVMSRSDLLAKLPQSQAREYLDFAIEQAEKNVALNRGDSFSQMILAQILNFTSTYYSNEPDKFSYYSQRAETAVDKCIEATPRRSTVYFIKAQIYLTRGEKEKAIDTLKYAVGLNPKFPDATCQLGKVYAYLGKTKEAQKTIDDCVDLGGADTLYSGQQLVDLTNRYVKEKRFDRVVKVLTQLSTMDQNNVKIWTGLAEANKQIGHKAEAVAAARKAAEIDPSLKSSAEQFIQQIQ